MRYKYRGYEICQFGDLGEISIWVSKIIDDDKGIIKPLLHAAGVVPLDRASLKKILHQYINEHNLELEDDKDD